MEEYNSLSCRTNRQFISHLLKGSAESKNNFTDQLKQESSFYGKLHSNNHVCYTDGWFNGKQFIAAIHQDFQCSLQCSIKIQTFHNHTSIVRPYCPCTQMYIDVHIKDMSLCISFSLAIFGHSRFPAWNKTDQLASRSLQPVPVGIKSWLLSPQHISCVLWCSWQLAHPSPSSPPGTELAPRSLLLPWTLRAPSDHLLVWTCSYTPPHCRNTESQRITHNQFPLTHNWQVICIYIH